MIDLFSGTGAFSYVSSKYNIEPVQEVHLVTNKITHLDHT